MEAAKCSLHSLFLPIFPKRILLELTPNDFPFSRNGWDTSWRAASKTTFAEGDVASFCESNYTSNENARTNNPLFFKQLAERHAMRQFLQKLQVTAAQQLVCHLGNSSCGLKLSLYIVFVKIVTFNPPPQATSEFQAGGVCFHRVTFVFYVQVHLLFARDARQTFALQN